MTQSPRATNNVFVFDAAGNVENVPNVARRGAFAASTDHIAKHPAAAP